MIEVFKTDVRDRHQANMLIDQIQNRFLDYQVNFDLEDCDHILRVKSLSGSVRAVLLIDMLRDLGINAEILPDVVRSTSSMALQAVLSGFEGRLNP